MDFSKKGIIFDSALNSFSSLEKPLKKALEHGFEIEVIAIYNDPVTAFKNTIKRGINTKTVNGKDLNRFLSLAYFVKAFKSNNHKLKNLLKKYLNVKLKTFDNSNNVTVEVSAKEAIRWNYDLTEPQIQKLLKILENETETLKPDQLAAVASGLRQITETPTYRTSEVARLINKINDSLSKVQSSREGSRVGTDKTQRVRLDEQNQSNTKPKGTFKPKQGKKSIINRAVKGGAKASTVKA